MSSGFDTNRIIEEINRKGGKLISKERVPFGKGWIGEKNDRIYKVIYRDKDGNTHEAFVKTSSTSGVYFAEDTIIEYSPDYVSHTDSHAEEKNDLLAENEQLKRELEELKKKQKED